MSQHQYYTPPPPTHPRSEKYIVCLSKLAVAVFLAINILCHWSIPLPSPQPLSILGDYLVCTDAFIPVDWSQEPRSSCVMICREGGKKKPTADNKPRHWVMWGKGVTLKATHSIWIVSGDSANNVEINTNLSLFDWSGAKNNSGSRSRMIASTWDMLLSTGMNMNQGPAGADASSSLNSSLSCHRQLECSTGMTEGVSDHTATSPHLCQQPPFPISMPPAWTPPPALISRPELSGGSRQMARSCLVVKTQQVLYCQRPLHTSCLSLSPTRRRHYRTPPTPREPRPLSTGERRGGLSRLCFVISLPQLWSELSQNQDCVYLKASPLLCASALGNYGSASRPDRDDTVG